MSQLAISLLGTFEVRLNNESLNAFRMRRVQALSAYLICEGKRPSSTSLSAGFFTRTIHGFTLPYIKFRLWRS